MKSLAEVNFQKYLPLDVKLELKPSTEKKLYTYWSETCQRLDLTYKVGIDGYLENFDSEVLGPDFIVDNVQWSGNIPDEYEVVTLGELMESRERETEFIQFQVNNVKVEKLLVDKDMGFLNYHRLMNPIEIVFLPNSNQYVIGGGRHRLVALITMFKVVRGYEEFNIYVKKNYAKTMQEVASFIELSNMTRSMTRTETSMLRAAAKGGLTVFATPEDFFAEARKFTRTSDLKDLSRRLWTAMLQDTLVTSNKDVSINTTGDFGHGFISKFCRALNAKYGSGCDSVLLLKKQLPDGTEEQIFEVLTRDIIKILVENWNNYLLEIRKPKNIPGTREQKQDADGNLMWTVSPSRSANHIAQLLCNVMMAQVGEGLGDIFESKKADDKRKKLQKAEDNKVKELKAAIATLEGSIEQFKKWNMTIPETFLLEIAAKRKELEAEANAVTQAAEKIAEVPQETPVDLSSLLT